MDGQLPVNPSGGLLAFHPGYTSGLIRVYEAYLQVTGKAKKRQVLGVENALVHGMRLYTGQLHCVCVIER